MAIYEFNIGLQYNHARVECHAIANLTEVIFAPPLGKTPKPCYARSVLAKQPCDLFYTIHTFLVLQTLAGLGWQKSLNLRVLGGNLRNIFKVV
ncbi:MAG: hypothetical protein ABSF60_14910 [Verrucomicrobiota bacterium]